MTLHSRVAVTAVTLAICLSVTPLPGMAGHAALAARAATKKCTWKHEKVHSQYGVKMVRKRVCHRVAPRTRTALAGTLVLKGSLSSTVTLSMTGALSIGAAPNLDWQLPLPSELQLDGFTQHVLSASFDFRTAGGHALTPDAAHDVALNGGSWRDFHWNDPPADTVISVTETLVVQVTDILTPFRSMAPYPLSSIPSGEQPYLQETALLRLPDSAQPLLQEFQSAGSTEQAVVEAAVDWVASHVTYQAADQTGEAIAAQGVLQSLQANCQGYDDLAAGILRKLGIPARAEVGWVTAQPVNMSGGGVSSSVGWSAPGSSGELHTWLDVWFPGEGWVPFDPQAEKFFVDPRHIAFLTGVDAGTPDINNVSAAGDSWWGSTLSNGGIQIIPGFGVGSQVTVQQADNFGATVVGVRHDVQHVVMYSG